MSRTGLAQLLFLAILALLAAACDSSDGVPGLPDELSEEAVDAVVEDIVVPSLSQLDVRAMLTPPRSAQSSDVSAGLSGCFDASESCTSGSAEMCFDSQGFTMTFDSCGGNGETLDGSLEFLSEGDSGSVTFDLESGSTGMTGTISYASGEGCVSETISAFTVTSPGLTTSTSGTLLFCESAWPSGSYDLILSDSPFGSYLFETDLNGTANGAVTITDLTNDSVVGECAIDLEAQTSECTFA
ncbi:MAG: hypothetical protein GY716_16440 [bacterium]|nr:hypothetical protein [bacterium]